MSAGESRFVGRYARTQDARSAGAARRGAGGARHLKVIRIPRVADRCYRAYVALPRPPAPGPAADRSAARRAFALITTIAHLLKQKTCFYGYRDSNDSARGAGWDEIILRQVLGIRGHILG